MEIQLLQIKNQQFSAYIAKVNYDNSNKKLFRKFIRVVKAENINNNTIKLTYEINEDGIYEIFESDLFSQIQTKFIKVEKEIIIEESHQLLELLS